MALYDHIDVVRGATGLTFGAGNPSAAINMVRKRATSTEPTANVEVSAGSWDNYRVMGDIANSLINQGQYVDEQWPNMNKATAIPTCCLKKS